MFFSVVIPTYNRKAKIERAIRSLLVQEFSDFEVIIIDDGSDDGTREIVQSIQDSRVKYFVNDHNIERCASRNRGIREAKGKYICFLDSDDYHLPNHLLTIHNAIIETREEVDMYFTNSVNESIDGVRLSRNCPKFTDYDPLEYFLRFTVNPQRWAVKRDVFNKEQFDPAINVAEDMDFTLRICCAGFKVCQIDKITTVYCASEDSFTHGDPNKPYKELKSFRAIFSKKKLASQLPTREKRRLLSMCYFHISIINESKDEVIQMYLNSLRSFFLFPKGYNGATNKILLVNFLYHLPLFGFLLKKVVRPNESGLNPIEVPYPINVAETKELQYFKGKAKVSFRKEKVRWLRNVFVSHEGLCVKRGVFIKNSAFNMIGNEDNTHFFEFFKLSTEQYLVANFGKSLSTKELDADYLLVHSKWFNFYFWLTSSVYRLILTERYHQNVKLILPETISQLPFVRDTLLLFPNLKCEIIPSGEHLKVKSLLFPEVRKWSVSISLSTVQAIKSTVLDYAIKHRTLPLGMSNKIYVTRKNTGKRGITNEEEVEELLQKYGFSTVSFEDYDLFEQALIMEQATHVIGLHGAGFANILYMNPGGSLFEFMAHPPTLKDHRTGFWRLSGVIGLRYFVQFCDFSGEQKLFIDNNYTVNIPKLVTNLKLFLTKAANNS